MTFVCERLGCTAWFVKAAGEGHTVVVMVISTTTVLFVDLFTRKLVKALISLTTVHSYSPWRQTNTRAIQWVPPSSLRVFSSLQHRGRPLPWPWVLRPEDYEIQVQSGRRQGCWTQQVHEQGTPSTYQHLRWDHQLTLPTSSGRAHLCRD